MGRHRTGIIEKEENRRSAELILRIVGDRSFKEVAEESGVDPSTLSYLTRGRNKPTPAVIKKLTSPNANPQCRVTYDELMLGCEYEPADDEGIAKKVMSIVNFVCDYGFTKSMLHNLCWKHEDSTNKNDVYVSKFVEDWLTDCNFHSLCSLLVNHKYKEAEQYVETNC